MNIDWVPLPSGRNKMNFICNQNLEMYHGKTMAKGGGSLPGPGWIQTATEMTFLGLNQPPIFCSGSSMVCEYSTYQLTLSGLWGTFVNCIQSQCLQTRTQWFTIQASILVVSAFCSFVPRHQYTSRDKHLASKVSFMSDKCTYKEMRTKHSDIP